MDKIPILPAYEGLYRQRTQIPLACEGFRERERERERILSASEGFIRDRGPNAVVLKQNNIRVCVACTPYIH